MLTQYCTPAGPVSVSAVCVGESVCVYGCVCASVCVGESVCVYGCVCASVCVSSICETQKAITSCILTIFHLSTLSPQTGQFEWLVHLSALALDWLRVYHDILMQVEEEIPSSSSNDDQNSASPDVTECESTCSVHEPVCVCVCACVRVCVRVIEFFYRSPVLFKLQ